jgi:hypothetical protein
LVKQKRAERVTKFTLSDPVKEFTVLLSCVIVSVVVHGVFVVDGFGESDSARLGVYAIEWYHAGTFSTYSYAVRTSPLYIHGIKALLDLGVSPLSVPPMINWFSVILASLTLVPLYYLWRNLLGRRAAVVACVLFFFTPVYWLASVYSMAHLPAFSLFILSLLLFQLAAANPNGRQILLFTGSAVAAIATVTTKSDLILCFGAYLGIAYYERFLSRRTVVVALLMPVFSMIAVTAYTQLITADLPPLGASAADWTRRFPFTLESVLDRDNRLVPLNTVGWFFYAAVVASVGVCIIRRSYWRLLAFAALWALPALLFWGLKMGNSARHMMTPFCALLAVTAAVAVTVIRDKRWLTVAVGVLIIANYFIGERDGGTSSPTSQLHKISRAVGIYSRHRHKVARAFVTFRADQKVYSGSTTTPYVAWEAMAKFDFAQITETDPVVYNLWNKDGYSERLCVRYVFPPCTVPPVDGWLSFSYEEGVRTSSLKNQVEQKARLQRYLKNQGLIIDK